MSELKPCPFCGSSPALEDHRTIFCVTCSCGALVLGDRAHEPDGSESVEYWEAIKQTAIDRWNDRYVKYYLRFSKSLHNDFLRHLEMSEWISVSHDMPINEGTYLCRFSDGVIETFSYFNDTDYWGVGDVRVTHWMYLPDPPDTKPQCGDLDIQ